MSRIPPIENMPFPLPEESGMGAGASISTMSTLFRTMAHRPELARQSMQVLETAMRTGTVDPRLKELLAIRVSQVNHCHY